MFQLNSNLYVPRSELKSQSNLKPYVPSSGLSNIVESRGKIYSTEFRPSLYDYVPVTVLSAMMTSDGNLVVSNTDRIFQVQTQCGVPSDCATAFDYIMLTGLQCVQELVSESQEDFARKYALKTVYNPLGAFVDEELDNVYLITNLRVMSECEKPLSHSLRDGYSFQPLRSINSRSKIVSVQMSTFDHRLRTNVFYDQKIRSTVLEVLALDVTVKNLRPE